MQEREEPREITMEGMREIADKDPQGFEKAKPRALEPHIIRAYKNLYGTDIEVDYPDFKNIPRTLEGLTEFVNNSQLPLLADYDLMLDTLLVYANDKGYEIIDRPKRTEE